MKLKQILEETKYKSFSQKYENGKKESTYYNINGKNVTEERFRKEQKRRCLFKKKETFSESPGIVIGSIESDGVPQYVGITTIITTKYIPFF